MRKLLSKKTIIPLIILVAIGTGAILIIWKLVQLVNIYNQVASDYTRNTTPLTSEVVNDICEKFDFPATDERCQPNAIVYAAEFFSDIEDYFTALPSNLANYETVQRKLGIYLEYQTPVVHVANGFSYFECRYDLRGDRVTSIVIWFTPEGEIIKINKVYGGS